MIKELKLPFVLKLALVLVSIIAIGYLAKLGQSILAPMFFALLMAMLFLPFSNFLERRWRFSRTFSTFVSVLVMLVGIGLLSWFFTSQLSDFANDFPTLEKQIYKTFNELQVWVAETFHVNFERQMKYMNEGLNKLLSSTGIILGFTVSLLSTSLGFIAFSILFFIFLLNYRRQLYTFILEIFDSRHSEKVRTAVTETQKIIKQYISGLFIQIAIVSALTSAILSILGVKYALLLGVLTGLLNVIPYIGILVSALVACLIAFATGNHNTLWVFLSFIAIHAIDANVTLPLVVGSKVNINALFSFIGLLIGEHLWGISGMFLSIPFLAILKIIFEKNEDLKPWANLIGEEHDASLLQRQKFLKRLRRKRRAVKRDNSQ